MVEIVCTAPCTSPSKLEGVAESRGRLLQKGRRKGKKEQLLFTNYSLLFAFILSMITAMAPSPVTLVAVPKESIAM